jgi:hypothetical protein
MPVRDLLWACPICQTSGSIRPSAKREVCRSCGAAFRRSRGARILVEKDGTAQERPAGEWLAILGPVKAPAPDGEGRILGPERVRVKLTRGQKPLHWAGQLIGWVEDYTRAQPGTMTLRADGLHFQPVRGARVHWAPADLSGLQPASSSLQLGLHGRMASVRFIEGSVRLWTRGVSDLLQRHWRQRGREVLELQPCVRTCALRSAS